MPRSTPHRRALCFTPLQWLRTEAAAMTTALRIRGTPAEPRSRPPIKRALPDPVTPCEWISLRGVFGIVMTVGSSGEKESRGSRSLSLHWVMFWRCCASVSVCLAALAGPRAISHSFSAICHWWHEFDVVVFLMFFFVCLFASLHPGEPLHEGGLEPSVGRPIW